MPVSTDIIRKLAHGGLKPLQSLLDLLELYDMDPQGGLHKPETRKSFIRSIRAVTQAIRDLRLIAICDDVSDVNGSMNWKTLIEQSLPGNLPWNPAKVMECQGKEEDYTGTGHPELLASAVFNMGWFSKHFWETPAKTKLSTVEKDGESWVELEWDFGNSIEVEPQFSNFTPYFPMFPKKSLSLDQSTGLALCAVKRILEIHGGTLTANLDKGLVIKWSCPKGPKPKPNIKAAA